MIPETHRDLTLPPLHPALEKYRADLEKVARPAWLLRCHKTEAVSRFETHVRGDTPFMPVEEGWPLCDKCGEPMAFVWQIDLSDFHGVGTLVDRGLFQFFYCWDCFGLAPYDEFGYTCRWYPDFDAQDVRNVPQLDAPYEGTSAPGEAGPLRVEIEPFLSVPGKYCLENPIPKEALNEMIGDEGRLWSIYSFTEGLYMEQEMISRVGGYPPWVQFEDDTPQCPVCGTYAEFVGAIGGHDTGLIWGDSGYWYFFACQATPECGGMARPLMVAQCY